MHPTADTPVVIYFQRFGAAGDAWHWAASGLEIMKDILKSLAGGLSFTIALLFVVLITDTSSETEMLERHPFAWSFFWPAAFIPGADAVTWLLVSLAANVALYSLLIYAITRWRKTGGR